MAREKFELKKRMDAHTICAKLVAVRDCQYILSQHPDDTDNIKLLRKLQSELRPQINAWGSISLIDKWLTQHDPELTIPSKLEGLNTDWLNEK